jgi:hypothetical protein
LRADGTCYYNSQLCSADDARVAALQAKVVAIKARPPLGPHSRLYAAFPPYHRLPVGPIGHVLALAGTGHDPRRQGARPPPPPSACVGLVTHRLKKKCTARPTWTTHRRKGAPRVRCSAPFRRHRARRARAANPDAPPLFPSRAAQPRPRGASRPAAGCTCRFCTPHAAHTRRRASPSRFAPRTCTPAPSRAPNCDARSMRP